MSALEFLNRETEMCSTLNHPLCGCATNVIQKSPFHYNRGVQATIRENGTYMSANEVFLIDAVERERIATDINNFFRDGSTETLESLELEVYSYPKCIERLCELLSTQEGYEV